MSFQPSKIEQVQSYPIHFYNNLEMTFQPGCFLGLLLFPWARNFTLIT